MYVILYRKKLHIHTYIYVILPSTCTTHTPHTKSKAAMLLRPLTSPNSATCKVSSTTVHTPTNHHRPFENAHYTYTLQSIAKTHIVYAYTEKDATMEGVCASTAELWRRNVRAHRMPDCSLNIVCVCVCMHDLTL